MMSIYVHIQKYEFLPHFLLQQSGTEPNPAITWTTQNLPATANSFAVLMDDPTGGGYYGISYF